MNCLLKKDSYFISAISLYAFYRFFVCSVSRLLIVFALINSLPGCYITHNVEVFFFSATDISKKWSPLM